MKNLIATLVVTSFMFTSCQEYCITLLDCFGLEKESKCFSSERKFEKWKEDCGIPDDLLCSYSLNCNN